MRKILPYGEAPDHSAFDNVLFDDMRAYGPSDDLDALEAEMVVAQEKAVQEFIEGAPDGACFYDDLVAIRLDYDSLVWLAGTQSEKLFDHATQTAYLRVCRALYVVGDDRATPARPVYQSFIGLASSRPGLAPSGVEMVFSAVLNLNDARFLYSIIEPTLREMNDNNLKSFTRSLGRFISDTKEG